MTGAKANSMTPALRCLISASAIRNYPTRWRDFRSARELCYASDVPSRAPDGSLPLDFPRHTRIEPIWMAAPRREYLSKAHTMSFAQYLKSRLWVQRFHGRTG